MSVTQGQVLEVTVVNCKHLKSTEYVSRQEDPYVCLEYGSNRYHTRPCTDGDANLILQEKFAFALFEGSREISISVYNSNKFHKDDFIGRGRVQLQRVISQGYDGSSWPIFSESGRTTGEVCLMLFCPSVKMSAMNFAVPAAKYVTPVTHQRLYYTPSLPLPTYPSEASYPALMTYLQTPYHSPGKGSNITSMRRGYKRPLEFESYVGDEEELGRDRMRRKTRTEAQGISLQPTQLLDIAMDELLDRTSPATLDEDTEMACGSHPASPPYSTMWDMICF